MNSIFSGGTIPPRPTLLFFPGGPIPPNPTWEGKPPGPYSGQVRS